MRIKIRKSDKLFSEFIKIRDEWRCQKCFTSYKPGSRGLHNSHFWGRRSESVRFDAQNCDALCAYCHQHFTENPQDYVAWKREQLGEADFAQLGYRRLLPKKRDDKMDELYCKELLRGVPSK